MVYLRKLIKPDGTVEDYPPAGKQYTLAELQKAVGGYIQIVRLIPTGVMVINEDGKLQGLPFNSRATKLYGNNDPIVGPALVCAFRDIE